MFNYVPYFRTWRVFLSSPTFKLTISPKGFMTRCWRRAGGQTLETPSWPSAAPHDESPLRGTQRWPIFRWSSNKFGAWHSEGFKVRKVWSRMAKLRRNLKDPESLFLLRKTLWPSKGQQFHTRPWILESCWWYLSWPNITSHQCQHTRTYTAMS